ncbi:MAG: STAS domain-containing protein [Candidatus Obscuribacterales bacterium]|nr:STAS domain-containing protein [Candidatus Obscuribacterales bacterium]
MATESTAMTASKIVSFLDDPHNEILKEWVEKQLSDKARSKAISDSSIKAASSDFFALLREAIRKENLSDINAPEWEPTRQMLSDLSASRAVQGSSPTETANFVMSLKQVVFNNLSSKLGSNSDAIASNIWSFYALLDLLSLYTTEVFQRSREAIIRRQQKEMLEMSTPVIKLWDGILIVPLIGTLDSVRTQLVMENLLQKIVETGSKIAILDITGVPTVDTQTAQHLIKTVSATRLMGADCFISGIRPQIAQTIVHLGIDIQDITTKAVMGDAVAEALRRIGWTLKPRPINADHNGFD